MAGHQGKMNAISSEQLIKMIGQILASLPMRSIVEGGRDNRAKALIGSLIQTLEKQGVDAFKDRLEKEIGRHLLAQYNACLVATKMSIKTSTPAAKVKEVVDKRLNAVAMFEQVLLRLDKNDQDA